MLYDVLTEKFGTLLYEGDSIKEARKWAKSALGVGPRSVSRHVEPSPPCAQCQCRPCLCKAAR